MSIAQVLAELQRLMRLQVPGRKTYVVTGDRMQLEVFRRKMLDLVNRQGFPAVQDISLNEGFIGYIKTRGNLDSLIEDERSLRKAGVKKKLQKHLQNYITSALKRYGTLCLYDFELVFGYALELEFVWEWAVDSRQILFLVPGRQHHGDVVAYGWNREFRRLFARNLVRPEWTWVLEEEPRRSDSG